MRLKTKLVVSATGLTFAIVLILSALFVSELMRQSIEQTTAANDVLAHQVYLMTRQAVEEGLRANPPVDRSDEALHTAVANALQSHQPLADVMNAIVRYSPTVQDVSVTDAHGMTLVSTDPDAINTMPTPFSLQPGECAKRKRGSADAGGVWQAAGAGYLPGAGPKREAVSGRAYGNTVDVFKEFVRAVVAGGVVLCTGGGTGGDGVRGELRWRTWRCDHWRRSVDG